MHGGIRGHQRAGHVVRESFAGVRFHHSDMFVRRRVEDYRGPVTIENFFDARGILNIADHRDEPRIGLLAELKKAALGNIEGNDARRAEAEKLPAQLGADGTCRARDQRGRIREPNPDRVFIHADRLAKKKIFYPELQFTL